jgi:hypothetical protein
MSPRDTPNGSENGIREASAPALPSGKSSSGRVVLLLGFLGLVAPLISYCIIVAIHDSLDQPHAPQKGEPVNIEPRSTASELLTLTFVIALAALSLLLAPATWLYAHSALKRTAEPEVSFRIRAGMSIARFATVLWLIGLVLFGAWLLVMLSIH